MGAIAPVLTTIMQVGSVLGTVASVAQPLISDNAERKYEKRQNDLLLRAMQQDAALKKEQIKAETEASETDRRARLQRTLAEQRAKFGAAGVGANSGSSEAVLQGLFEQSDTERVSREKLDALRANALDQDIAQQKQLNLLQQTQLREKQYINYLSKI